MNTTQEAERIVYAEIVRASELELRAPTCEQLLDALEPLGFKAVSATADIVTRLEKKGLIRVKRYQRSRQIFVVENGKATAQPANTAPHWRERPQNIPAVPIHTLAEKRPDVAMWIQSEAKRLRKQTFEFIADLVYIGAVEYQDEQKREAA